jgi:hypothetical protein
VLSNTSRATWVTISYCNCTTLYTQRHPQHVLFSCITYRLRAAVLPLAFCIYCYILVAVMPQKRRAKDAVTASTTKRPKPTPGSTYSQAIPIESPQSSPRPSPRKAVVEASQVLSFEAQLRESQIEEYINPPTEGSEEATIATSESNNTALDEELEDNFNGIDWDRLPRFMKPIASQRHKKSWVYNYGWRVALRSNPQRIYFVCRYCYEHKLIDLGVTKVYETTNSTSSAHRHLGEKRRGHGH